MKSVKILKFALLMNILLFLLFGMNSCSKKKAWVAKIENEPITVEDFNVRFEYYLKSKYFQQPDLLPRARNSMEERKSALKDMINERVILIEAKKLKIDNKQEVKDMVKLYTQQIILNAYIEQHLAGSIKVNEKDIDEYYNKYRAKFKDMDPDKAKFLINRELSMQQYEIKLKDILDKLRDKYVILENENAIRPIISETSPIMGETNIKRGQGVMKEGIQGGIGGGTVPQSQIPPKQEVKPEQPKPETKQEVKPALKPEAK